MQGRRFTLAALATTAALFTVGVTDAAALKGCVKAPKPALTEGRRHAKVPLRLEPGLHSRVERRLSSGTEVWISTSPRLRRICPNHGFYPVVYENRLTYEEVPGWIRGSELR
jgi:hypothetical protein